MPKYPSPSSRKPAQINRGGRPRKDRPTKDVKVTKAIHEVCKQTVKRFNEKLRELESNQPALSMGDYVGEILEEWAEAYSQDAFAAQPIIKILDQWKGPWNYIYIDLDLYNRLAACSRSIEANTPATELRIRHGNQLKVDNLIGAILIYEHS